MQLAKWHSIALALAPKDPEPVRMLSELIQHHGGVRDVAALLGCSVLTLYTYLQGKSQPPALARKAIWLAWAMTFEPERLRSLFDVATWGRFEPEAPPRKAREPGESFMQVADDDWSI